MKKTQDIIAIILMHIRRIPRIIGEHAFPAFLSLIVVSFIISGIVVFLTVFSLRNVEPSIQGSQTAFKEQVFFDIIDIWQARDERLDSTGGRLHEDLFEVRP